MVKSISQKYYVYTLSYPEDYPDIDRAGMTFYVGKGTGNRIDQHEIEARTGKASYKCNVIRKIWANGYQIVKQKIAFFHDEQEAFAFEQQMIAFLGKRSLTNIKDGGESGVGGGRKQERELIPFGKHLLSACERIAEKRGQRAYSWAQLARDAGTDRAIIVKAVCGYSLPEEANVWLWCKTLQCDPELEALICHSLGYSTEREHQEALARIDAMEQEEGIA